MINKETVSGVFRHRISKPLSFRDLMRVMDLGKPEGRRLKRILREMLASGEIVLTRKGLYGPSDTMSLTTGYFEAHRDGYGFVVPEKPGERDVFIPPRATLGAMNGDRVIARIENPKRRDGSIIRILDRVYTKVAGRMDITRKAAFVKPKNRNIPFDLYVAPEDRGDARHGDNVLAEIISFPSGNRPPSAKVVKIIGKPEDPRADVEAIIDEFNLPRRFPKKVSEDAKAAYTPEISDAGLPRRKDLRSLPTVTIDGEMAKDFDDAVSVSLMEHGYRLWVHIADVGFYVPWDSPVDAEARKRGTSVYFPDRVIPMLPKELSEDLCSLRPGVDRFSFTAEMDFDRYGKRLHTKFYPSVIKSNERMTYTSVRKILVDQDKAEREKYDYLLQDFELMGELCGVLRSGRLELGSLDFDLPEPEILLDLQGNPEAIIRAERNFAHMMIEEFMIAANEAVAEYIEKRGLPCIYRIHEEPDPMKLEDIFKVVRHLGRFSKKTFKPGDFSALLRAIKDKPEEETVNYIVLRSLKQARYSTINAGHFGLASTCYTHFTSPIRRYPDLVVHRILREILTKKHLMEKRIKELEGMLPDIAFHSSHMERLSDDAEREVIDAMRVWFMRDKIGEEFAAKVVGVTSFGLKVRLKDFYVEGFLHISNLTDDFYQYDDRTMRLYGRHSKRSFRIGQELTLRVDKVDMEEREIIFGL